MCVCVRTLCLALAVTGGTCVCVCVRTVCLLGCLCVSKLSIFGKYSLVSISPVPRWVHWGGFVSLGVLLVAWVVGE